MTCMREITLHVTSKRLLFLQKFSCIYITWLFLSLILFFGCNSFLWLMQPETAVRSEIRSGGFPRERKTNYRISEEHSKQQQMDGTENGLCLGNFNL
uniref:Uncharacterized protein n=1 Tax=Anguilla anguilla TaxID=7936 RepID=A0A0E9R2X8_ANGAN